MLAGGRLAQTKKTFGGLVARLRLLAPCLGRGVEELTNEVATAENDLDIPAVDLIDALAMAVTARDWCTGGTRLAIVDDTETLSPVSLDSKAAMIAVPMATRPDMV